VEVGRTSRSTGLAAPTKVPEAKSTKVRTHLDLFVEHAAPMVAEMVDAGSTSVAVTEAGEWTTSPARPGRQ
jgi:hypothetical protein